MKDLIKKSVANYIDVPPSEISVDIPENDKFGDYSTNIAMIVFSKKHDDVKNYRTSREFSEKIAGRLRKDKAICNVFERIEVAGPGFINFWLKNESLFENLQNILREGGNFGKCKNLDGKKIMVEFAHPNTHKELHIGHMRTLILGESLSRIFEFCGAEVFRANYQGDIGPHVAKSIWGTEKILKEKRISWEQAEKLNVFEKAHLLGEGYVKGNKDYERYKEEIDSLNNRLYKKEKKIMPIYEKTRRWSLNYYDMFYSKFYTHFDRLYFESDVEKKGREIVEKNIGKVFEESEGAIIFDGEKYGLHKRVFITKEGNPTYEAKDMALAPLQYKDFPFDLNIHVVANEQKEYFRVIFKALELIEPKFRGKEFHLPMGMVNLVGRKMSSRTGEIITVESLLEEIKSLIFPMMSDELSEKIKEEILEMVLISSIKYSMLKVNPTADVIFDPKLSVNLEGDSGPYLQYTFARTKSVLKKATTSDQKPEANDNLSALYSELKPEELVILRSLVHFPEIIKDSSVIYSPNLICNYLYDLASKFNNFYAKYRIIDAKGSSRSGKNEASIQDFRLLMTAGVEITIKNGLMLLGIKSPEKM